MKRFYDAVLRCGCLTSIICVIAAVPAFAEMSIRVGTIDRYADGADVPVTIYEDEEPAADISFSYELYENDEDEIISEGLGTTDINGEALIEFSELPSDMRFAGEIWVGSYDDPEAAGTFSFSTNSDLESKTETGCNAGIGGWMGLILSVLILAFTKPNWP
jgi:hypothetical protein